MNDEPDETSGAEDRTELTDLVDQWLGANQTIKTAEILREQAETRIRRIVEDDETAEVAGFVIRLAPEFIIEETGLSEEEFTETAMKTRDGLETQYPWLLEDEPEVGGLIRSALSSLAERLKRIFIRGHSNPPE